MRGVDSSTSTPRVVLRQRRDRLAALGRAVGAEEADLVSVVNQTRAQW
jgi:hypothetical protein